MWPLKRKSVKEKWFYNAQPLPKPAWEEIPALDFAAFPVVEDFTIKLEQTGIFGGRLFGFGLCLRFYSPTLGYLASFPWWDYVEKDLPHYTSKDIPVGDLEEPIEPFFDVEQGWQIYIFEHEDYVYVMQGNADMEREEFYSWFRVPRDRYFAEWMKLIRQFNPAA